MDPKLPHFHFCFDCLGLHKWEDIKLPELKYLIISAEIKKDGLRIGGKPARRRGPYYLPPPVQFRFAHLQLAMRRSQHGPSFGIRPDSLRYTEVRESIDDLGLKTTRLISVEARILPRGLETIKSKPSLCLRVQELRYSPKVPWVGTHIYPNEQNMICRLLSRGEPRVRPRERSRFKTLKFEPMVLEKTESTNWINLGPGISPYVMTLLPDAIYARSSPQYRFLLVGAGGIGSAQGATCWRFGDPHPYSQFEGHVLKPRNDTISVDALASFNNYFLCDERYRLVMNSIGPSHWVLQGENEHRSA